MKASKENAVTAKIHMKQLRPTLAAAVLLPAARQAVNERLDFLDEFLEAAQRKLPTENAYQTDRKRVRKKVSGRGVIWSSKRIKAAKKGS